MDEYRQPTRPDGYKPHRERETPTQFRNEDPGRVYDRSIERVRRALDNYESERRQREDEDSKQKTSEGSESNKTETTPDLIEELNKGDWRNMSESTLLLHWFEESGQTLSSAERNEFFELVTKKMMEEASELKELDSKMIELEAEMLGNLVEVKSTTEGLDMFEKQSIENGAELKSQPDGQNKTPLQKEEINYNEIRDSQENDIAVEIESPLQSADQITSEIASQFENAGYEAVSTEIQKPVADVETQFKSLESEFDKNLLAQPEISQTGTLSQPEVVQAVVPEDAPELKAKKANAETESELGNGEIG